MQMTRKYTAFVSANWDQPKPEYTLLVSSDSIGGKHIQLHYGREGPYTIEGFKYALNMWQTTKLLPWTVAIIYTLTVVPWAGGTAAADVDEATTFDDAIQRLPNELVAEAMLEGILV